MNEAIKSFQWGNPKTQLNSLHYGKINCINSLGYYLGCVVQQNGLIDLILGKNGSCDRSTLVINSTLDGVAALGVLYLSFKNGSIHLATSKLISACDINCNVDDLITDDYNIMTEIFKKTIFSRQDGTPRLSYYDNTDTLQIVDVDA